MALNFRNVPISFEGGIDATDEVLLSPRKVTVLENCVFDDKQTIVTRTGLTRMSLDAAYPSIPSPNTRTNAAWSGTPYRISQNLGSLLLEGSSGLFAHGAYTDVAASTLQVRTNSVANSTTPGRTDFSRASCETTYVGEIVTPEDFDYSTTGPLISSGMGRIFAAPSVYTLNAWVGVYEAGGGYIQIRCFRETQDSTTGEISARVQTLDFAIPATGISPAYIKVLSSAARNRFYVVSIDSGTGTIRVHVEVNVAGTISYPTYTAAAISPAYDVTIDPADGRVVIAYASALNTMRIAKLDATVSAESFGSSIAITSSALNSVSLGVTNTATTTRYQTLHVCTATNTVIRSVALTSANVPVAQVNVLTATQSVGRTALLDCGTSIATSNFFYEHTGVGFATSKGVFQSSTNKTTLAGTGSATAIANNAHLYGKPVYDSQQSKIHVPVCFILDTTKPTIFVMAAFLDHTTYAGIAALPAITEARIFPGAAGYLPYQVSSFYYPVPDSFFDATFGDMYFPAVRLGAQAVAIAGEIASTVQLYQAKLSFRKPNLGSAEIGGSTYLAGACPQIFDGTYFAEEGFNHRPVIGGIAYGGGGSGSLAVGTYFFQCTYVWRDSRGNRWESEPSELYTASNVTAGAAYTLTVLTPGITAKQNVKIRIYRSVAGAATGALLYLDDAEANTSSVGTLDADITGSTLLPTAGGRLPNLPMPGCRFIFTHQNRLWCVGGEVGDQVYTSQPISENIAPEWNYQNAGGALRRRVPPSAGRIVSGTSLDDKAVLFCENRIGFIYGEGPSATGENDNYSQFVESVSGYSVPWQEPNSMVRATDGVWFRSGFGFRLLGRNLSVLKDSQGQDVASELDARLTGVSIKRALIGATSQQARFYTASDCYVYDMLYGQWSTFSFTSVADAVAVGDDFYHMNLEGTALFVNPRVGSVYDDSSEITSTVETGWLSLAGVQGFQRVSRLQLIGQSTLPPTNADDGYLMTVTAFYDYDDDPANGEQLAPTFTFPRISGDSASMQAYEAEIQLATQKCRAIKLRFSWVFNSPTVGDPATSFLRLTSMNLRLGIKQGRAKLAASLRK